MPAKRGVKLPITISTTINGAEQELTVRPNQTLLECLRDDLSLEGSVEGCGVGRLAWLAPYWSMDGP